MRNDKIYAFLGKGILCPRPERKVKMATSSITANFAIRDADEAKRFVAAFLSTDNRPQNVGVKSPFKFVTGVENLRRQISRARKVA